MAAEPKPEHLSIVAALDAEQATMGYNEMVTGLSLSGEFTLNAAKILRDVEVARSLYVRAREANGNSASVAEKAKLKRDLIGLAQWSRKKRDFNERFEKTDALKLEQTSFDLDGMRRSSLDGAIRKMQKL